MKQLLSSIRVLGATTPGKTSRGREESRQFLREKVFAFVDSGSQYLTFPNLASEFSEFLSAALRSNVGRLSEALLFDPEGLRIEVNSILKKAIESTFEFISKNPELSQHINNPELFCAAAVLIGDRVFIAIYGKGGLFHMNRSGLSQFTPPPRHKSQPFDIRLTGCHDFTLGKRDFLFLASQSWWSNSLPPEKLLALEAEPLRMYLASQLELPLDQDRTAFLFVEDHAWQAATHLGWLEEAESISRSLMFQNLRLDEVRQVLGFMTKLDFAPGDYLMEEGAKGDVLYLLIRGRLEVFSEAGLKRSRYLPGETVGELSFLDDLPRSATVQALSKATVLEMRFQDLKRFIRSDPESGNEILFALGAVAAGRARERSDQGAPFQPRIIPALRGRSK